MFSVPPSVMLPVTATTSVLTTEPTSKLSAALLPRTLKLPPIFNVPIDAPLTAFGLTPGATATPVVLFNVTLPAIPPEPANVAFTTVTLVNPVEELTPTTIGALAQSLGYGSESAFSTAFKRITGSSPRSFRSLQTPASSQH